MSDKPTPSALRRTPRSAFEEQTGIPLETPCPNAGDPAYAVDYGIGHGHSCALCRGTGVVITPSAPAPLTALERELITALRLCAIALDCIRAGRSVYEVGTPEALEAARRAIQHAEERERT
jgi:hypothetical protein